MSASKMMMEKKKTQKKKGTDIIPLQHGKLSFGELSISATCACSISRGRLCLCKYANILWLVLGEKLSQQLVKTSTHNQLSR